MRPSSTLAPKALWILVATAALQGCGGGGADLVEVPTVAAILVEPSSLDLELGEERRLDALPVSRDGARMRDLPVSFRSDDSAIAKVDADGKVTGLAPGATVVRLECEGTRAEVPAGAARAERRRRAHDLAPQRTRPARVASQPR